MSQTPDGPSFSVYDGGEEIALPATVRGIRRALASELRPEFDSAVETTPAQDLYGELAAWALKTRPRSAGPPGRDVPQAGAGRLHRVHPGRGNPRTGSAGGRGSGA
ncbi:hypothetical protein [Streptomyces sp. NPDC005955]|uniref:hypothetical protein n=1 Tax=Streptomyces sp. NPDC005955 TaxID=3364738 RepID=UPI003673B4D8